jgi:hypothetical protein
MQHHRRKRDAQSDCGLLAVQDTGIAVPAFLRVLNLGGFFSACGPEDIRRTDIRTDPTGIAFFFVNDRRHERSSVISNQPDSKKLNLQTSEDVTK